MVNLNPQVAVIIPTYNRASLLKGAIDSVLAQTYRDYELIVVDDGSDDETSQIVQQHANCRYIRLDHSGLPAVARNAGVRSTGAPYIAFLDSDDAWLPHKLEKQVHVISSGPFGFVCSNARVTCDNGRTNPYLRPDQGRTGNVLKDLIADNFVITSSVLLRRDLFDLAGRFSEDGPLRGLEDYDLWLRIAAVTEFCYIPEELAVYRTSGPRLSDERPAISHWETTALILSRCLSTSVKQNPAVAASLQRQLDTCRRAICDEHLRQHSLRSFAGSFARFCSRRPVPALKYLAAKMIE